jgi:hypothetical protein
MKHRNWRIWFSFCLGFTDDGLIGKLKKNRDTLETNTLDRKHVKFVPALVTPTTNSMQVPARTPCCRIVRIQIRFIINILSSELVPQFTGMVTYVHILLNMILDGHAWTKTRSHVCTQDLTSRSVERFRLHPPDISREHVVDHSISAPFEFMSPPSRGTRGMSGSVHEVPSVISRPFPPTFCPLVPVSV